ncbi:MAG: ergothioneine biosynthesis protein EgtB [Candidatus Binatia bacterium]
MLRPQPGMRRARVAQPDLLREAFARSVIRGLGDHPRWLSCRYLYDQHGSAIFERITEQSEYYPTRTEDGILAVSAERIRELCDATTLVELGAGSATKTRHLLRAWSEADSSPRYVAIDISRTMLAETCEALRGEFPRLDVRSVAGSYEQALVQLGDFSPLTLLFLGSSIGNFNEEELDEFFPLLASNMADGDRLLLGIDLVKDIATLEAAYNDAAGWSAAFTLNLFARMNREFGTDLNLDSIEHVARWNAEKSRIDIFARFNRDAVVRLPEWQREFRIAAGEMVLVEISRKFACAGMTATAARHGFAHVETFTDPDRLFALLLLRRTAPATARSTSTRERLRSDLAGQRTRTLELLEPLDHDALTRQHCPILSPVVWDLGHIASFEREWTARAGGKRDQADDAVVRSLYDPVLHPRSVRGSLPLADPNGCLDTLADARAATEELLEETAFSTADPLLRGGYVFSMIAQHEAQHSETILQGIQLLPGREYEPAGRIDPPGECGGECSGDALGEVFVPAGPFTMGTDDRTAAYDNERPAHEVELASFWIDVAPVTNATWLRFVEDGGYCRHDLWTAEGWRWLREARVEHPAQWIRNADGSWSERAFGRVAPLDDRQPVVHVCWHEAAACAQWLGKRLPTEAEWEKAAAWDLERSVPRRYPWGDTPPTPERANLDQRNFAPAQVGALPRGRSYFGCHQMLGDVWEWTSSDFLPYPGFRPFPYPEYSQMHFGSRHKVLRGGAWATPSIAIRNTFRNWDLPQRRQIFAGLRCARD